MIQALMTELLTQAARQRASDVYILPSTTGYVVRWRLARRLVTWRSLARAQGQQILTYVKFHADMAVSEQRRPQTGSMTWQLPEQGALELRFSTVGDYAGVESLVIRLIYPYQALELAYLVPSQQGQLQELAHRRGLLLFAGPTGSGKTTTMYTVARALGAATVVLTIEDPVEIREARFIQLQVNPAAGMTYDELIKVGLRHRPDVFIIGEIRDQITAQAAVRAALSGHLVLSTVHARTARGTIARLTDLGVPVAQLHQVLTAACYQRLIPRVGQSPAVLLDLISDMTLWQTPTISMKGWRAHLEHATALGTITAATERQYAAG